MRAALGLCALVLASGTAVASAQTAGPATPEATAEPSEPPPLVVVVEVWGPASQATLVRRFLSARLQRRVVALPPEQDAEAATLVTILVSSRRGAVTLRTADGRGETRTFRPEGHPRDATWIVPHVLELLTAVGQGPPAPPEPAAPEAAEPPEPAPASSAVSASPEPAPESAGATSEGTAAEEPEASAPSEPPSTPSASPPAAEGDEPAPPPASTESIDDGGPGRAAGTLERADGLSAPRPSR